MIRLIAEIITYGACALGFFYGLLFVFAGVFYPVISEIGPEIVISGGAKLSFFSVVAVAIIYIVSKVIDTLDAIKESKQNVQ